MGRNNRSDLDTHSNGARGPIQFAHDSILKSFCFVCFLSLLTGFARGQRNPQSNASPRPNQIVSLISGLYTEVVARHPLGIPYGADEAAFSPYLSAALRQRFDLYVSCAKDWREQNPDPHLKPEIGLIENGVFSGGNEEASPQAFRIERVEPEKNGSSRVYIRLKMELPPNDPLVWYVAAVVVREADHLAVDDVLFLKNKNGKVEGQLTKYLSTDCDGPRWIGNAVK